MKNIIVMLTCLVIINGALNHLDAATVKVVDGVTYIHNTETPKLSQPTIELKEEWRIGGEDPGFFFNSPTGLDVDDDGRILITDLLEKDVKIFSPTGKFEIEFGSEGNGPGEFKYVPTIVSIVKDKLLVIDSSIAPPFSRFNYFDYKGSFIGSEDILLDARTPDRGTSDEDFRKFMLESRTVQESRLVDGNLWLRVNYANYTQKESCQAIYLFDIKNKVSREIYVNCHKSAILNIDKVKKQDDSMDKEILWCENKNNTFTVIPDIYDYKVYIYDNLGALAKVISRDFTIPLKSKRQYERNKVIAKNVMELLARYKVKYNVLKKNSIIRNSSYVTRGLFYDDKERFWVLTNETFEGKRKNVNIKVDNFYAFDIFDSQGEYLMRIPLKTQLRADCFKYKNGFLYFFDSEYGGYIWLVKMRVVDR